MPNTVKQKGGKPRGELRVLVLGAMQSLVPNGVVDSGTMRHFLQKGVGNPTGETSRKVVGMPNGQTKHATQKVMLPMQQLKDEVRKGDELSSLQLNSLVSVPILANHVYTTIFWPEQQGVDVYKSSEVEIIPSGEPVLRGWRDSSGLWCTPLVPGEQVDDGYELILSLN